MLCVTLLLASILSAPALAQFEEPFPMNKVGAFVQGHYTRYHTNEDVGHALQSILQGPSAQVGVFLGSEEVPFTMEFAWERVWNTWEVDRSLYPDLNPPIPIERLTNYRFQVNFWPGRWGLGAASGFGIGAPRTPDRIPNLYMPLMFDLMYAVRINSTVTLAPYAEGGFHWNMIAMEQSDDYGIGREFALGVRAYVGVDKK